MIGSDVSYPLPAKPPKRRDPFGYQLGNGFNLDELVDEVKRHYLEEAWSHSGQTKSKAAELVGYKSYQKFDQQALCVCGSNGQFSGQAQGTA